MEKPLAISNAIEPTMTSGMLRAIPSRIELSGLLAANLAPTGCKYFSS